MNAAERLRFWQEVREQIRCDLAQRLPVLDLARPILEEDLAHAERMIAYYEERLGAPNQSRSR